MIQGTVQNGSRWENNQWVPVEEPGLVVINPEVCERLLPAREGFFFGSTNYDQYYIEDLKETVSQLRVVLETTDFETQMLYYRSSW